MLPESSSRPEQHSDKPRVPDSEGLDVEKKSEVSPVEKLKDSLPVVQALAIFIASNKGEPMQRVDSIAALAGLGLEGDRYATRTGAFSSKPNAVTPPRIPDTDRQVALISRQGIEQANEILKAEGKQPFTEEETRRNIVVDCDPHTLNGYAGKRFMLAGGVIMEGVEPCDPCGRPSALSGKPNFESAFKDRGGLRARIINNGTISIPEYLTRV